MYRKLYKRYNTLESPTAMIKKPLKLLVVAPMVTFYSHCKHCMMVFKEADLRLNQKTFQEYPPEWQDDYRRMGQLLREIMNKFQGLEIELVDPQTPLGLYKSLRYAITKYPTFILEGKKKVVGWQKEELIQAIETMMKERTSPQLSPQTP